MARKRIIKITNQETLKAKPTVAQVRAKKRSPIYVVLENVRSLYNVGAIFRSCDAALCQKVFLTGITGTPPRTEIDKSALGATDVVPWEYCDDACSVLKNLKSQGVSLVALELTHRSVPYFEMKCEFPACLIVGNEVDGVSQAALDLCDFAVDIPMLGRASSLNVATACGIALFEILRKQSHA